MTDKEKEIYEKVKNDPEDFMFDLLFQYDESGNIKPIKGKTLKLMADGIPMVLDEASAIFSNNFIIGNSLDSVRTNKSYQEIMNEIALTTPFGKKSAFYKERAEDKQRD